MKKNILIDLNELFEEYIKYAENTISKAKIRDILTESEIEDLNYTDYDEINLSFEIKLVSENRSLIFHTKCHENDKILKDTNFNIKVLSDFNAMKDIISKDKVLLESKSEFASYLRQLAKDKRIIYDEDLERCQFKYNVGYSYNVWEK